ncbi:MAG: lysophospholipase [Candidatus Heimdallarchaeota archaeon]
MEHQEAYFEGLDGYRISYQFWKPEQPKAVVQIFHGGLEHIGRYRHLVEYLISENIAVYGNDNRGHGKSEGRKNHIRSFDDYVEDSYSLSKIIKKELKELPLFIVGHSMGSLVAQRYILRYQKEIKGAVLSGSGTRIPPLPLILRIMVKIFSKIWPTFKGSSGIIPEELSSDPESVEDYKTDPLIQYKFGTAAYGSCFIKHYPEIKETMHTIKIPVLIQKGELDTTVIGLDELIKDLKNSDLTVKLYPKAMHEMYTETKEKREEAFKDFVQWLEKFI